MYARYHDSSHVVSAPSKKHEAHQQRNLLERITAENRVGREITELSTLHAHGLSVLRRVDAPREEISAVRSSRQREKGMTARSPTCQ